VHPEERPMSNPSKDHWEHVYTTKAADAVSWFQQEPTLSLDMIAAAGVPPDAAIVDIGGGASLLVDRLLDRGFTRLTILDVSESALALTKARLGFRVASVAWLVQDATSWEPPPGTFMLWHDRAVFHFLVDEADRHGYLRALDRGLAPGWLRGLRHFCIKRAGAVQRAPRPEVLSRDAAGNARRGL